MKKLILIPLLVCLFRLPAITQTYTWVESFNSGVGWSVEENWTIADGKLQFYWSPQIPNFDLSAVSPVFTLPETVHELTVTQYLDVFSGTGSEFAEIRLIHEGNAVSLWNYNLIEGTWGNSNGVDLSFEIEEYAGQDVQVEFRTYGQDTFNWNWWDVYEIRVSSFFNHDLSVLSLDGPAKVELFETGTWSVLIKNLGTQVQDEFAIQLFDIKTGDMIGSIENPESIAPAQTMTFDFEWSSQAAYNTAFYCRLVIAEDEFEPNNISGSRFVRIEPEYDYNILFWDNDNGIATVVDPEKGNEIEASKAFTNILDMAGMEYDYYNYLPDNLYDYQMIFSTMGCFCVS
jgi:hypothetical protein